MLRGSQYLFYPHAKQAATQPTLHHSLVIIDFPRSMTVLCGRSEGEENTTTVYYCTVYLTKGLGHLKNPCVEV